MTKTYSLSLYGKAATKAKYKCGESGKELMLWIPFNLLAEPANPPQLIQVAIYCPEIGDTPVIEPTTDA